ncbi:hypothetical protein VCHA53O466_50183 [Vibrio chagasii]|nr:hypothetical protein VCHA53O466_50183 [Vibrio chagasii]
MILKVDTKEELRALRYLMGFTSNMMAELCGLSLTTLNQIELGNKEMSHFESVIISAGISNYPYYRELCDLYGRLDTDEYLAFIDKQVVGNKRSMRVGLSKCGCGEKDGAYSVRPSRFSARSLFIKCKKCRIHRECLSTSQFRLIALKLGVLDPFNIKMYEINHIRYSGMDSVQNLETIIGEETMTFVPAKQVVLEEFDTPNKIIAFRAIVSLSARQIANRLGIDPSVIRKCERGKTSIHLRLRMAYLYLYKYEIEQRPELIEVFDRVDSDELVDLLLNINNGKVPMTGRPYCRTCGSEDIRPSKIPNGHWITCNSCGDERETLSDSVKRIYQLDKRGRINMFNLKWYESTIKARKKVGLI